MSYLQLYQYPHPILREKAAPVVTITPQIKLLVAEMQALMHRHNGVGLAAPQVGVPLQLFVTIDGVHINPALSRLYGSQCRVEGCLSIPGIEVTVRRPANITITSYDLAGHKTVAKLKGLPARVAQHEYDHVCGMLFLDRLHDRQLREIAADLRNLELEFQRQPQEPLLVLEELEPAPGKVARFFETVRAYACDEEPSF